MVSSALYIDQLFKFNFINHHISSWIISIVVNTTHLVIKIVFVKFNIIVVIKPSKIIFN